MFTAGSMVEGGYYFDRDKLDLIAVGGRQGALPGVEGQRYYRIPALAALPLATVLGGLFVVFMPLVGIALVLRRPARLSLPGMKRAGRGLLFVVSATWRSGKAYLAGRKGKKQRAKEAADAKTDGDKNAPSAE